MTTHWTLHSYGGRLPWPEVREHLEDATCTWQDLNGLHIAGPPHAAPIATHLWGWSSERYFRARIDDDHAYLAMLTHGGHGTPVPIIPHPSLLRSPEYFTTDHQIPELERLEIPGEAPATFLRPRENLPST